MDKKKIISSLALAGILSASVLGANVKAAAGDYLKPVGVYKQLIEGRTVVPYVLESADSTVTVKDVKGEFKNLELVNGNNVTDEGYVLKTGDTFKADGTEYSVVIYGDVDKNGIVDTFDARAAQRIFLATEGTDAFKNEAADVVNDGVVDTFDALRIQQFYLGNESVIDKVPAAEAPEEEDSIYTVSVNDNGYINSENAASTVLNVSLSETFDEAKTLNVKAKDENDEDFTNKGTVVIPAHTDYVESTGIDLSGLDEGKITIQLLDGEKVVAEITAEKNVVKPAAANVITDRSSTKSATISLEACGDSDIVKVHYLIAESQPAEDELVNTLEVSGNKVSNATIANDLETNKSYKVWYVLENSYGSKSEIASAIITTDDDSVTTPEAVEEVVAPDLTEGTTANFTWEGVSGVTYAATLYKDGKIVATETGIAGQDGETSYDFADKMTEAGTYKVEVYQEATESSEASAPTSSAEVKVEKLPAVTDLQFRNEDGKVILSWANPNDEDNFKDYSIKLYTIDKDGKEVEDDTISSPTTDKNEVEVTSSIDNNVIYVAKVVVNAKTDQMAEINSDEAVSSQFYKVGTPTIDEAETSEHEITLNVTGVSINGKTTTYKIKVFDVNESENPEEPTLVLKDTRDVEIKDGKVVIDGLESNKPYAFKLIAIIDGEEVESDYVNTDSSDQQVRTLPELKNLTKVATAKEAEEPGKVYSSSESEIIVGGETFTVAKYNNSTKFANSLKVINTLKTGDVVTIEDQKITLKLDNGASASSESRDFSTLTGLEEVVFDIESNKYNKTIKTPAQGVKEVILRGTDSMFNIADLNAEKIILTYGVEVSNAKKVTVDANSTVIINGAKVTTNEETAIDASTANTLNVTVNENANDLVFENVMEEAETLTINFVGSDDFTSAQAGSIKIKSTGGKVTVSSTNANVSAELTIEVNSGDVDITSAAFTGDKNVTVSVDKNEDSTINAIAKTTAPVNLDGVSVDIKDEDLLKEDGVTEDNLDEVKNFLASFGLNGTGATITATKDSAEVTITITAPAEEAIENVEIGNLK